MEPYTDILYSVEDLMATITINRPKTLNAFTQHTIYEMEHAFRKAEADSKVGVIVFTGVGERAFSSGGDMHWEAEGGVQEEEYNLAHMIIDSPKPVIAKVNGYAIGGANHLAYFCDITIRCRARYLRAERSAGGFSRLRLHGIARRQRARP